MHFTKTHPVVSAILSTLVALPLIFSAFFLFEPAVVIGQVTDEFTVTQTIDQQIAFTATTSPVTMSDTLGGLTGGDSTGDTGFAVATNAPGGYTVTIQFASSTAMISNEDSSFFISNQETVTFNLNIPSDGGTSRFAYTVVGDHVVDTFRESGSACNEESGATTATNCWFMGSDASSAFTIVDRDSPTAGSGDAADLYFRVVVPTDPNPALIDGTYTATATLTAAVKMP